ncbi:MAG: DUF1385 domain-containing protein [Lachnospiraceae bacterium]|nr:DUF1385 domain-containing protein [Lachnospiraceae bacterium]
MRSSGIGGQAVMEGVMMKNKDRYAVAVRKPDKEIEVKVSEYKSLGEKYPFFALPIIRGMVAFVESLIIGMKTLTFSAEFFDEEPGDKKGSKKKEKNKSNDKVVTAVTIVLSIIIAVGIFMIGPYFISRALSKVIESEVVLTLIEGVIRVILFLGYIIAISQMKEIRRVFMYHGAEHKSINCIESGLELTVENAMKSSRFHKRCGTSFLLVVMCISILLFMFIRVDAAWLRVLLRVLLVPVIAGISYEFIKLAGRSDNAVVNVLSKPGLWLQRLTTREPEADMLECAITSVEAVFDWKAYLEGAEESSKEDSEEVPEEKVSTKKNSKRSKNVKPLKDEKSVQPERLDEEGDDEIDFLDFKFSRGEEKKTEENAQPEEAHLPSEETLESEEAEIAEPSETETEDRKETGSYVETSPESGYMMTPEEEEDDEILKKLDKYFETRKKGKKGND